MSVRKTSGARNQRPCPVCGKPVAARDENAAFPFCAPRCQLVDLSRWLDGDYRFPSDEPAAFPLDED